MISTDCVVHKLMVKTAKDLCGHTLVHVEEEKGLGVIVDSQLNLRHTLSHKVAKAMAFLGLIRRNFQYLNTHSLLNLYKAFVRPHLEYAQSVWSPSSAAMNKDRECAEACFQLGAGAPWADLPGTACTDQAPHAGPPSEKIPR